MGSRLTQLFLVQRPSDGEWRVAIKQVENGVFSTWANGALASGDTIRCMAPTGRFILEAEPTASRNFIAFAAGPHYSGSQPNQRGLAQRTEQRLHAILRNRDTPSTFSVRRCRS